MAFDLRAATTIRFAGNVDGYLYEPAAARRAPALIVLHERYGLAQHTLDIARRFAENGYVALAPDLFSRWQGDHEALARGDIRVTLPDGEVADIVDAAMAHLREHPGVDGQKIVLMGVCQSGRYPVVVASERDDVAACVVLYGAAQEREWPVDDVQPRPLAEMLGALQAPSLWVFGEGDHTISIDDVLRVRGALEQGRRSYRMRLFPSAPHGWLNDTMPGRYRPEQAEEVWSMLFAFLQETLAGAWPPVGQVRWEFQGTISPNYDFSRNVRYE